MNAIFEGLVGQTRVKDALKKAVVGENLPQTLVFAGPDGVGKATCAQLLAKHLHGSSDGKADTFIFSDILAEMREQKKGIKDAVDEMIKFMSLSPIASKYKVAIIDDAEALSISAQNALLKTLEEPRADTVLIVTVMDETTLLPTILSRARVIKFGPLSVAEIQAILPEINASSPEALARRDEILQMAQGSLGWSIKMDSDDVAWADFKEMIDFWKNVHTKDVVERFAWANKKQDRDEAIQFLRVGALVLREDLMREPKAQTALDILNIQRAIKQIGDNVNVRLALEAMLIQL
jgi:DNA polymerase-3 subunit delta'